MVRLSVMGLPRCDETEGERTRARESESEIQRQRQGQGQRQLDVLVGQQAFLIFMYK